jgi:hypothetical protein
MQSNNGRQFPRNSRSVHNISKHRENGLKILLDIKPIAELKIKKCPNTRTYRKYDNDSAIKRDDKF